MNNLSTSTLAQQQNHHQHCCCCKPIPALAIYVLISLFLIGFGISIFILVVVNNAIFLVSFLCLSALVAAFLLWNAFNYRRNGAVLSHIRSLSDSDLSIARHGQLVKVTGLVSCGNVSLESAYEKVGQCVYTSTMLYESELGLTPSDVKSSCFQWRLTYCERYSTDFYITDRNTGVRVLVNAGPGCKVIPLIMESKLVRTTRKCRVLSPHLRKWLRDRNLSSEAHLLRLEEGYIREGSVVSVIGMLHRNNDVLTVIQPHDLISTGCQWPKLLLPVDIDGLVLGLPKSASSVGDPNRTQRQ